jgi:hypothetical protein
MFRKRGSVKKVAIFFSCLALISLACLSTGAAISDPPVITVESTSAAGEEFAGAVYDDLVINDIVPTLTKVGPAVEELRTCAIVVAIQSLHLRKGPSEKDIVLTWLNHNDLVQVLDQSDPDWWFIESRGVSGYARSIYLEIGDCHGNE